MARLGRSPLGKAWVHPAKPGLLVDTAVMSEHREVTVVNRGLLVEVLVVAIFILVVLMMFGVSFA